MTYQEMVAKRMQAIFEHTDQMVAAWSDFIEAVNEGLKEKENRELNEFEKRNIAICMENALIQGGMRNRARLFEETTEDNISFLGIQLPVIAALLPSLALNDVALIQAIDRRIAAVFYFDVKAGTTKGSVTAGDSLIHSKTGHNTTEGGRRYAMAISAGETIATGDGTVTATLAYAPGIILMDQIVIKDSNGNTIGTSTSSGAVTGTGITGTGTISADGTYTITFTGLGSADALITYYYQYDLPEDTYGNKDGVPEVDFSVSQSTVTAVDFPVRSKYSIGAALDLMKAHGMNLENEVTKYLGNEVKFTIDQVGLDMIDEAAAGTGAATAITNWNAKIQSGQEWVWKKREFLDRMYEGNTNIIKKTLRANATFIIAGLNVARVIQQLEGNFKPTGDMTKKPVSGPVKIGTLDGRDVILNPFKNDDSYTMGYRGDNYLMAGFVACPYIPLFTTPTLVTSDLMAQKGFYSSCGFKVVNAGMFCTGTITNIGTIVGS